MSPARVRCRPGRRRRSARSPRGTRRHPWSPSSGCSRKIRTYDRRRAESRGAGLRGRARTHEHLNPGEPLGLTCPRPRCPLPAASGRRRVAGVRRLVTCRAGERAGAGLGGAGGASRGHRGMKLSWLCLVRVVRHELRPLCQAARRTWLRQPAPRTVAVPIRTAVPAQHQLGVAPEQAVNHLAGLAGSAIDGHVLPPPDHRSAAAPTGGGMGRMRIAGHSPGPRTARRRYGRTNDHRRDVSACSNSLGRR